MVNVEDVLLKTIYSLAVVAVKEPCIELVPVIPKTKLVGWDEGAVQDGKPAIDVAGALSTVVVKYNGPPVQMLFTGKMKK